MRLTSLQVHCNLYAENTEQSWKINAKLRNADKHILLGAGLEHSNNINGCNKNKICAISSIHSLSHSFMYSFLPHIFTV